MGTSVVYSVFILLLTTFGGGFSQNGLFWGAAQGTMAPSAICFEVVLADGTSFQTGSDFLRPFGPDITGIFAADCGALGGREL